jgi:hypothetical protein
MPELMEATTTQRGEERPANVSVEQLTAMLKKPRTAKAAASAGSSPANQAAGTGGPRNSNGSTTTGTAAAVAGAAAEAGMEAGSSSDGLTDATGGGGDGPRGGLRQTGTGPTSEGEGDSSTEDREERKDGEGEEGATEADAEGDEGGEVDSKDVPKAIRQLQKRIAKLTKARTEMQQALEEAKAQAQQASQQRNGEPPKGGTTYDGASGVDPRFAGDSGLVKTLSDLTQVNGVVAWAEDALDAMTTNGGEEAEFEGEKFNRAQVRQILRNAKGKALELTEAKATRVAALEQTFNRALAQHNAAAVKAYPWIQQKDAPEHRDAQRILQEMPFLMNRPDRLILVADFVEGRKAREAREKAAGGKGNGQSLVTSAATKTKVAPLPTSGSVAAVRGDARSSALKAAEEKFAKSGQQKDLTALLKLRREAQMAG